MSLDKTCMNNIDRALNIIKQHTKEHQRIGKSHIMRYAIDELLKTLIKADEATQIRIKDAINRRRLHL